MTLIEILVVISIVLLMAAIALPAISVVRRKSAEQRGGLVVRQLAQAMESYRLEDGKRSYPSVHADGCLSRIASPGQGTGNLQQLEDRGYYAAVEQPRDSTGRVLDPWQQPYRYDLVRPTPATPIQGLNDWNWDAAANRINSWGRRVDATTHVISDGPLPFPYVWSLGRARDAADATYWIYPKDARP